MNKLRIVMTLVAGVLGCGHAEVRSGDEIVETVETTELDALAIDLEPEHDIPVGYTLACPAGMVYIRPGSFRMGCPGTENLTECNETDAGVGCDPAEGPAHDVTLSGFCIDRTEVTCEAYKACLDAGGPCAPPRYAHERCNWSVEGKPREGREQHPVNCVNWVDGDAYCRWRTGCEGSGCGLPTEAQWEYAARGPGTSPRKYPWGATPPDCTFANYAMFSEVHKEGECVGGTSPVCSTPLGNTPDTDLCDMSGNVWEVLRDYFAADFFCRPEATGVDPVNTTESEWVAEWPDRIPPSPMRVVRGQSWYDDEVFDCRASLRDWYGELEHASTLGIRCVAGRTLQPIDASGPQR